MPSREIEQLIQLLAKLPGLGPRSARRATLHLIKRREALMQPLSAALTQVGDAIVICTNCGNLDAQNPCGICQDQHRNQSLICVVEDVADLWALERAGAYKGQYHVLGGVLSALDGVGPEDLNVADLIARASTERVQEIVLAMNATVDGQTTAHYLAERLEQANVAVSRLAHGVPVGGELDYLDDGTLAAAMKSRRPL
jgi:recombination protein RecR